MNKTKKPKEIKHLYSDEQKRIADFFPSKATIGQAIRICYPEISTKDILELVHLKRNGQYSSWCARQVKPENINNFYNQTETCQQLSAKIAIILVNNKNHKRYESFEDCLRYSFGLI